MVVQKAGKYDAVLPGLRRETSDEVKSVQQEIDHVKSTITNRDAREMAIQYVKLRKLRDQLAAQVSAVFIQTKAYEQLLAESQERQSAGWGDYGVKDNALKLVSGGVIRIQPEPQGKVVDPEAFRLWCISNGYERQLTMNYKRMDSLVKERLAEGEAPPEGCEAIAYTKVVYTKGDE